ncbi:MAG: tetratricopeptide repeat protein, partial [Planctomycetota bacterium]|nr:tetratricopeptide repeat protein [Planctomycetota bacterium]
ALNNLAWLYVEVKAVLPEAESLASRSVAGYRSRLEILDKEGIVARSGGKDTAALLEKIEYKQKQYVSEMGRALSTLGHSLFLQDKHKEAIASWQDALSLTFPDDEFRARLHYNIGRAYSKSGNASAAETSLRAAFRLTKKTELLRLIGEELEILRNLRAPEKNALPSDRPS